MTGMSDIEIKLRDQLYATYPGALDITDRIVATPLGGGPLPSLEEINANILTIMEPIVLYMCSENSRILNLQDQIRTSYYEEYIDMHIDPITYNILSATSKWILGLLIYHVHRDFIFNYIKYSIVMPNIYQMVSKAKSIIDRKTVLEVEEKDTEELIQATKGIINHYLLDFNMDALDMDAEKFMSINLEHKKKIVESTINSISFAIPDFLKDALIADDLKSLLDAPIYQDFFAKYIWTHTDNRFHDLMKQVLADWQNRKSDINELKVQRDSMNNAVNDPKIDTCFYNELHMAKRILTESTTHEDIAYMDEQAKNGRPLIKQLYTIIKEEKRPNESVKIEDATLIITNYQGQERRRINFMSPMTPVDTNDPLIAYGPLAEAVRRRMRAGFNPMQLTGMTKDEEKLFIMKGTVPTTQGDSYKSINHRKAQIERLSRKFKLSHEFEKVRAEMHPNNRREGLKYVTPSELLSSDYIVCDDEFTLLKKLMELEAIQNQITKDMDKYGIKSLT